MMNQDNPYAMNQTCKVCGEPAAGFHFGAFTCEGCKSFFGRSYNNLSSISDCKNNGECIINKKNRTACKACRLRKCLMVGMSKSGSRYGRRSNWFKIHCLLQEQQQQAAAAMAAHHNNQQQAAAAAAAAHAAAQHGGVPPTSLLPGQKPPPPPLPGAAGMGVQPPPPPSSAAAAAALGMLGHAGAYPGLYPPRTKEELLMLGLEEYAAAAAAAKHPTNASPSVSSPDSHNSDSSVDVNTRNPLLHLGGGAKHLSAADSAAGAPPQLRKDLPHFLPLPFAGLGGMPVMPPPAFLPPSHLLFPGYHPALYAPHHQSLLKPSPEQQQQAAAAAAAVHQLFNTSNATPSRFPPSMNAPNSPLTNAAAAAAAAAAATSMVAHKMSDKEERTVQSPKSDALNNNHIPNGSKAAEELTKRFYLDAVLKSQQRNSPPPTTTKLPEHTRHHDHSISALVTPNSDSGRELLRSRQSNDDAEEEEANSINNSSAHVTLTSRRSEEQMHTHATNIAVSNAPSTLTAPAADTHSNGGNDGSDSAGEAELVVSMTPPRSPLSNREAPTVAAASTEATGTAPALQSPRRTKQQDNPIDLSMKTGSSIASSLSSKCSSSGSVQATDSDNEHEGAIEVERRSSRDSATTAQTTAAQELLQIDVDVDVEVDDDDEHEIEAALPFKRNGASRNNNNANSSNTSSSSNNNNNNDNNRNCNASTARFSSSDSDESGMKLDAVKRKLHANKPQHSDTLQQLQHAYTADADALQVKRLKLCAKEANVLAIEKLSAAVKLNSGGNVGAAAVTSGTPPAATTTPLDLTTKV